MKLNAKPIIQSGSILPGKCQVEKVVEVSSTKLTAIIADAEASRPFLAENKGLMREEDGVAHCLLVLGRDGNDGVLVLAELGCTPRRAYLTGARSILTSALEQAADWIIAEAVENTSEGSWSTNFDQLYEQSGLVVSRDNGIGPMLLGVLRGRMEVSKVKLTDSCFDAVYLPGYCKNLSIEPKETKAERQERLINEVLGYLGEHHDSSELYEIFHGELGMTRTEVKSLGFDLPQYYEKEHGIRPQSL